VDQVQAWDKEHSKTFYDLYRTAFTERGWSVLKRPKLIECSKVLESVELDLITSWMYSKYTREHGILPLEAILYVKFINASTWLAKNSFDPLIARLAIPLMDIFTETLGKDDRKFAVSIDTINSRTMYLSTEIFIFTDDIQHSFANQSLDRISLYIKLCMINRRLDLMQLYLLVIIESFFCCNRLLQENAQQQFYRLAASHQHPRLNMPAVNAISGEHLELALETHAHKRIHLLKGILNHVLQEQKRTPC
jgi:hypothetical protein